MNTLTHPSFVQILNDRAGRPEYVVLPVDQYHALVRSKNYEEPGIPAQVVNLVFDNNYSPTRAWRCHLELTQAEVAKRMGITQPAYSHLETTKTIRKSSRIKIAKALNIDESQLDF
jgi:DNA-binding XRE family transcriptional regulator